MSDLDRILAGARPPRPPDELRGRVRRAVAAAAARPAPNPLDRLWASPGWWLGWSLGMVLLTAADWGGGDPAGARLAESLQRQRGERLTALLADTTHREPAPRPGRSEPAARAPATRGGGGAGRA